jgi:hypothetical protein
MHTRLQIAQFLDCTDHKILKSFKIATPPVHVVHSISAIHKYRTNLI